MPCRSSLSVATCTSTLRASSLEQVVDPWRRRAVIKATNVCIPFFFTLSICPRHFSRQLQQQPNESNSNSIAATSASCQLLSKACQRKSSFCFIFSQPEQKHIFENSQSTRSPSDPGLLHSVLCYTWVSCKCITGIHPGDPSPAPPHLLACQ